jgi:nucleoside-diphosphate-sugar epimerase
MKILLTGASGLLGNAYAEAAIRRGHQVIALYNTTEPIARGIERSIQIDAQQLDKITAIALEIWPETIVNCAAISSPADVDADAKLAEKINVALPRYRLTSAPASYMSRLTWYSMGIPPSLTAPPTCPARPIFTGRQS